MAKIFTQLFHRGTTMNPRTTFVSRAIAALTLTALSIPAWAQTDDGAVIEEILVTAQKREQSLQEVPISITALQRRKPSSAPGIREFTDYASKNAERRLQQHAVIAPRPRSVIRGRYQHRRQKQNSVGIYP